MVFGDVGQPSDDQRMKPYRNAAMIVGSLVLLVITSAGEGFSPERLVFLVTAALVVLAVLVLTVKALRDERSER